MRHVPINRVLTDEAKKEIRNELSKGYDGRLSNSEFRTFLKECEQAAALFAKKDDR